jgi:ABC-type branched-subunit amino acid transport system ATPase component/ABC-type branched-subunit amino acid transport system permease subunit
MAAAALGAAFQFIVLRRMTNASTLAKIVATLAVLVILQDLVTLTFGPVPQIVTPILPDAPVSIFGALVGEDRLFIFGIVLVLTLALWAAYQFTPFGVATSAVAENPRAAANLGVSPNAIAMVNWGVGAALGGVAAILLAPITSLSSDNLSLIVIPIMAAATVGRFSSFPATTLAGLAIGIAQSEVTRYVLAPGWATAVPFAFVAVALIRGRAIPGKEESAGRLPGLGIGRIKPTSAALAVAATLFLAWSVFPFNWLAALQLQLVIAIIMMSYVVVTGYSGQVSLVQFGLAGIGAVMTGFFYNMHGWPFELALLGSAVSMIPICALVGLIGVRTRGIDLAIVTLGLGVFLENVILANPAYIGGDLGFFGPTLKVFGVDVNGLKYPSRYATFALILLVLVCVFVANLRRGRAGRRLIAVRTNERAAASLGVSVVGAKLYAFILSGAIAAIGGSLLAFDPLASGSGGFSSMESIVSMQGAVFGGIGHISGPLIASGLQGGTLGQQVLSFARGNAELYPQLASGFGLLLMLSRAPDGLASLFAGLGARWHWPISRRRDGQSAKSLVVTERKPTNDRSTRSQTLRVRKLSVHYGGTAALVGFDLDVAPGEVVGLIGPNGSGKTTALEAIAGFVKPSEGSISLGHRSIDRWSPERRARAGLSRSFQSLELFDDLTTLENVRTACDRRDFGAYLTNLIRPGRVDITPQAHAALREFGLLGHLEEQVRHLNYAPRRLLAVARAVASGGSVLLLDEPAAGLSEPETETLSASIRRLAAASNLAILLIEHNVDMVLRTCDRVYALDSGILVGQGSPREIRNNAAVVEAYLGTARFRAETDGGSVESMPPRSIET